VRLGADVEGHAVDEGRHGCSLLWIMSGASARWAKRP